MLNEKIDKSKVICSFCTISAEYVPVIVSTLVEGAGICYACVKREHIKLKEENKDE